MMLALLAGVVTTSQQKSYIMQAIRKVWLLSDARKEALRQARFGKLYLCNECGKSFARKEVHVDHREPIGSFLDWNTWIERLFCNADNLQILCKSCHKSKTNRERDERREQSEHQGQSYTAEQMQRLCRQKAFL